MIREKNSLKSGGNGFLSNIFSSLEVDFHHTSHVVKLSRSADIFKIQLSEGSILTDELDVVEIAGGTDCFCIKRPGAPYAGRYCCICCL